MARDNFYLVTLLALCVGLILASLHGYLTGKLPVQKLVNPLSIILGLASILQLKIVGWFDAILSEFGDEQKYPYGPPSYITRQIIDNPDTPVRTMIKNYMFFDANFGFQLAVASLVVAFIAIWLD